MNAMTEGPVQGNSPPQPPKGGPPKIDLTPSLEVIKDFYGLVKKGRQRYQDMMENGFSAPANRTERETLFKEHYQTTDASTGGELSAYGDDRIVETTCAKSTARYINAPDPAKGEIRAYGNRAPSKNDTWKLSGSDILYFQYRDAAAEVGNAPLKIVKRQNVASDTGNVAMACARYLLKDALMDKDLTPGDTSELEPVTFDGDRKLTGSVADVFYAWLGTENGTSATWLVRDWGDRLSIAGISRIVVTSVQNITIEFTPSAKK